MLSLRNTRGDSGQLHGGVTHDIGQAMLEAAVYDENGQLASGSYMDYAMLDALWHLGVRDLDMALTPQKGSQAIQQAS